VTDIRQRFDSHQKQEWLPLALSNHPTYYPVDARGYFAEAKWCVNSGNAQ
jgi:hypothetical protein